jgi:hypothetical protein
MLRQCRVLRESPRGSRKYSYCQSNSLTDRLYCTVLLPLFTVVGMDRCEENWYSSDNNLRGNPCVSRKKRTRAGSPHAISRRPCPCRGLENNGMSEHGMGAAWAWHGKCESDTTALVNQMGKTHSKLLATRHGRGTAWKRHGQGMLFVNRPLLCFRAVM